MVFVFLAGERYFRKPDAVVPAGHPSLTEFGASLRPMARNEASRRYEELGAAVGLDVVPRLQVGVRPSTDLRERFQLLRKNSLALWLDDLQVRADDEDVEAPAPVQAFLAEHHEPLVRLATHLREWGSALEWDMDPGNLSDNPMPNLLGILDTARILAAATLEADRRGRGIEAEEFLDASFRLAESLERRPEVITFLIAQAIERIHHVQLRRLRHPAAGWAARLDRFELLPALRNVLRAEAFSLQGSKALSGLSLDRQLAETARSLDAMAFATTSITWERAQAGELATLWKDPSPRGNIAAAILYPNYATESYRTLRRNLDRELTALILRARSPETPSCEVESLTAKGKKLRLERLDGDRFRVEALVGPENPPPGTKPGLPLSFLGSRRD